MMIRLDKYLSDLGIASRKELKSIIRSGRISVDGIVADVPDMKIDAENNSVFMDGKKLEYRKYRYFIMNKPAGFLTAAEDKKQATVIDLLPEEYKNLGLFPVGRLDKDTTGLLILTNDGEYAHRVISPKYQIIKKYIARTESPVNESDVSDFKKGIVLRDGLHCLPAELEPLEENFCVVKIMEGKYHQVKRMLASVGKPVISLHRVSIGGIILPESLPSGAVCEISPRESLNVFSKNSQKNACETRNF